MNVAQMGPRTLTRRWSRCHRSGRCARSPCPRASCRIVARDHPADRTLVSHRISLPGTPINRRLLRTHAFEHPVDHYARLAEIVRGVAQSRELGTAQVPCDLLVFREQIKQWKFLPDRLATDVVD